MLELKNINTIINNEYMGIQIIEIENPNLFLAQMFEYEYQTDSGSILLNSRETFISECYLLSNLTKANELYNFTSKNILYKTFIEDSHFDPEAILLANLINEYCEQYNLKFANNLLDFNLDKIKLLKAIININDNLLINKNILFKWLESSKNSTKQTIILNNFDNIKLKELLKHTNSFNFILFTNNMWKYCSDWDDLEACSFYYKNEFISFQDINLLKTFIFQQFPGISFETLASDFDIQNRIKKLLIQ
ncbi:hypothetical protein [Metamycoplasma neophronis]|uniref:BTB domain-containing protein n=1 Tax=Metamycoplasma neophronis TaxID=872983 RepID=A0ABY2YZ95_9BACT|nr:hypothetical protein [Metamycoplasma neophronis]TPR53353.1 hypothetical protein FJR74_02735 [Metamycoplasma neophronis]